MRTSSIGLPFRGTCCMPLAFAVRAQGVLVSTSRSHPSNAAELARGARLLRRWYRATQVSWLFVLIGFAAVFAQNLLAKGNDTLELVSFSILLGSWAFGFVVIWCASSRRCPKCRTEFFGSEADDGGGMSLRKQCIKCGFRIFSASHGEEAG